jgi:hypothetical protein
MWRAPSEQQALNPVTCVVTYLTSFFFGDTGVSGDWFGFSVALLKKKVHRTEDARFTFDLRCMA